MGIPYGPVPTIGSYIEVTSVCQADDQVGMNVFHYRITANPLGNKISQAIASLEGFTTPFSTAMKACISDDAEFRGYLVRMFNPAGGLIYSDPTGAGVGTGGAGLLPRQVTGLLSKKVSTPGRRKGGRVYVPFPSQTAETADGLGSLAYTTALGVLAICMQSALVDSAGDPFGEPVVAVKLSNPIATTITNYRTIDLFKVSGLLATQRRRGSYGRTNVPPV